MAWYYWLLIVAGVVLFGVIKVQLTKRFLATIKRRQEERERRLEDDR